jgi:hypothetical protein
VASLLLLGSTTLAPASRFHAALDLLLLTVECRAAAVKDLVVRTGGQRARRRTGRDRARVAVTPNAPGEPP